MTPPPDEYYRPLLEAVSFAARAHQGQMRKDGRTPYVAHVMRAMLILRDAFGIADRDALTAAVLHDTIEDTTTDFDDVTERFGPAVAGYVVALTKDKRLAYEEREDRYLAGLASAPWPVKVCKFADIFDNLMDSAHLRPEQRAKTLAKSRAFVAALSADLPPEARRAHEVVTALLARMGE